ncbi:methyltransferase domain-containing protein [Pseudomonas parakoreensis]
MNKLINSLGTPMTQEQYAQEWKVDAEHISNDGHHAWMAEQLGPQDLVVEIGCGAGASTLALARKSRVICVESNSNLVELCKNNLLANEVSVQVVSLSELAQVTSQVAIVNGDVFDVAVEEYLKIVRPAAIVCWLIGAAPETIAKNIGKNLGDFTGEKWQLTGRNCTKESMSWAKVFFRWKEWSIL